MKSISILLLLAALTVTLTGACKSKGVQGSGFLGDYSMLEPNKEHEGSFFWQKPGADLRKYSFVMIDPIIVDAKTGSATDKLSADLKRRATDGFKEVLFETIDPYYTVVPKKAANVLRVRIALTDLTPDEGKGTAGSASLEVEMLDSMSREVLVKAVSRVTGSKKGYRAEKQWRAVEGAFIEWAERLLDFMDSFQK